MKSVWSTVSFLAIVNLFALLLFIGWLWRSDRLSMDRIHALRELFTETVSDQAAEAAIDAEDAASVVEAAHARFSSGEQLTMLTTLQEQEQQSTQRMKDESDMLARQFELLSQNTRAERDAFELERQSWEEATRAERERKADEQFAQTVLQYESLPAKQGKDMINELVQKGKREQAVAYLDAMKARSASKILREFKTPEELVLATELLEELRMYGLGTVAPKEPGNDDTDDSPDQSAS